MKSRAASISVLAILVLGTVAYIFPLAPAYASTDCTSGTDPFSVTGATWGTAANPVSAYPGEQNVPLTVTMIFSGPCTSPQTTLYLELNQGVVSTAFTGANGGQAPSLVFLNTSPNTIVTETFDLNINQNAPVGVTYYIPMLIQYSDNSASDIITQTNSTASGPLVAPIALYGTVQLTYSPSTTHLTAGGQNNVTLAITNAGTGSSGPVTTTVSAPAGVTVLNQLPVTPSFYPGGQTSQLLELFVASSLSGSAVVLTLTSKYLDQYSIAQTSTETLGFTVPAGSTQGSSAFLVEGASWGTATGTASPLPGTQDEPVVVTLQYLGSSAVTSLQGNLQLPAGFTNLNGGSTATAYSAASTGQYATVQLTFNVDVASSVKAGGYNFTLNLSWMTASTSGLTESVIVTPPPVSQLQSSFQVENEAWEKSANSTAASTSTSPVPGSVDAPLVVTLQYLGTTSVSDIEGTLTLPAGFTDLNGQSTATAFAATATANQVVTLTFYLDVASSVKPGSFTFPLALSWQTSVGVGMTQSATVAPPPVSSPSTSSYPLAVSQTNSTITAGSQSSSTFTLTNQGTATIYSPTFSLEVTSPVVLASAGSPVPEPEVEPGATATFGAHLTAGPSATPGIYGGTLTVVFTDSSGTSHTQSFPLSFTVEGTVVFVLQDTTVSQSTSGFTITGSILNEGSVAAYYASITGLIQGASATPAYIGEIDPNTPTPFSVTIPFTAPTTISTANSTGAGGNSSVVTRSTTSRSFSFSFPANFTSHSFTFNGTLPNGGSGLLFGGPGSRNSSGTAGSAVVALTLSYQDTFGNAKSQAFSLPTTVKTASELGGSGSGVTSIRSTGSGDSLLTDIAYGVVGLVVLTLVVGAVMVRRMRARRLAETPMEEKSVI